MPPRPPCPFAPPPLTLAGFDVGAEALDSYHPRASSQQAAALRLERRIKGANPSRFAKLHVTVVSFIDLPYPGACRLSRRLPARPLRVRGQARHFHFFRSQRLSAAGPDADLASRRPEPPRRPA